MKNFFFHFFPFLQNMHFFRTLFHSIFFLPIFEKNLFGSFFETGFLTLFDGFVTFGCFGFVYSDLKGFLSFLLILAKPVWDPSKSGQKWGFLGSRETGFSRFCMVFMRFFDFARGPEMSILDDFGRFWSFLEVGDF